METTKEQVTDLDQKKTEISEEPTEHDEPSEVEQLAQKLGWNPNHKGPDTVGPDEFILRTSQIKDRLTRQTRNLQREMTALREGVDAIKYASEQQRKHEVAKLKSEIDALKAERKQAIAEQDVDKIDVLDNRIDSMKDSIREAEKKPDPPKTQKTDPLFDNWLSKNEWYTTDPEMRAYADAISNMNPNAQLPDLLDKVDTAMKRRFSDKLPGDSPTPPDTPQKKAAVASSRQRPKPTTVKATKDDLSFEQRQVGLEFVTKGVFKNLDEYAQSLQDMEGGK